MIEDLPPARTLRIKKLDLAESFFGPKPLIAQAIAGDFVKLAGKLNIAC